MYHLVILLCLSLLRAHFHFIPFIWHLHNLTRVDHKNHFLDWPHSSLAVPLSAAPMPLIMCGSAITMDFI
jgi:hypothetical protein